MLPTAGATPPTPPQAVSSAAAQQSQPGSQDADRLSATSRRCLATMAAKVRTEAWPGGGWYPGLERELEAFLDDKAMAEIRSLGDPHAKMLKLLEILLSRGEQEFSLFMRVLHRFRKKSRVASSGRDDGLMARAVSAEAVPATAVGRGERLASDEAGASLPQADRGTRDRPVTVLRPPSSRPEGGLKFVRAQDLVREQLLQVTKRDRIIEYQERTIAEQKLKLEEKDREIARLQQALADKGLPGEQGRKAPQPGRVSRALAGQTFDRAGARVWRTSTLTLASARTAASARTTASASTAASTAAPSGEVSDVRLCLEQADALLAAMTRHRPDMDLAATLTALLGQCRSGLLGNRELASNGSRVLDRLEALGFLGARDRATVEPESLSRGRVRKLLDLVQHKWQPGEGQDSNRINSTEFMTFLTALAQAGCHQATDLLVQELVVRSRDSAGS